MENEDKDGKDKINQPDVSAFTPPKRDEMESGRLHHLLQNVQSGWKITIYRQAPAWCRGLLETIEIYDPEETIDIEALIRRWGGQALHVRVLQENGRWVGGGTIPLYSYPPKVRGKEIHEHELYTVPQQQNPQQQTQQITPFSGNTLDLGKLLDLIAKGKTNEVDILLKMLERIPGLGQQPQQSSVDMMSQMLQMFTLFSKMRTIFGESSPKDEESMIPMIGDLVKNLVSGRKQSPVAAVLPPRRAPTTVNQNRPLPRPETSDETANLSDFASRLARLSPTDTAEVVAEALGNMPESKRQEAMTAFLGMMGGAESEDDLDAEDESDDTLEHGVSPGISSEYRSSSGSR